MLKKIAFSILWLALLWPLTESRGQSNEQAGMVVQTGHSKFVSAVAFSPDGRTLASGARYPNRTIKLWDIATGRELRSLAGHRDDINTLVFSPNGEILASAGGGADLESGDYTVKLWEVASGKLLDTLEGNYPVFTPDGKTLAYAGERIKLWSITEHREEKTIDGDYPLGFGSHGTAIVGLGDGKIKTWDVRTGAELSALPAFSGDPRFQDRFVISSSGTLVATTISPHSDSSPRDKSIKIWDLLTSRVQIIAGGGPIAFTPDSKGLASETGLAGDGSIRLWDIAAERQVRTLIAKTNQETIVPGIVRQMRFVGPSKLHGNLAFSPDGRTIASGIGYGAVGLWDTKNGKDPIALLGLAVTVPSLAFSHDGRTLATGSGGELWGNNSVKLWDLSNNGTMRALVGHKNSVNAVAFSHDDKTLASGGSDQAVNLWDVATGATISTLARESNVNALAFSVDGKHLAAGRGGVTGNPFNMGAQVTGFSAETNLIDVWEVSAGQLRLLRTLPGGRSMVHAVAFSANRDVLMSGTGFSSMETTLWKVSTGEKILTIAGLGRAFSPDGKLLAVETDNSTVELRDAGTGALVKSFGASSAPLAFSPDGRTLALAGESDSINLCDLASGAIRTLEGQANGVMALDFSPDGQVLASSADSRTRLWLVASGKLLATLVSLDKDDWAVVTPDGLFDASPGARKLMHYVVGMEVVTLNQMKDHYYVPGLLQKVMKGEMLPKVQLFTAQDLFPEAQYKQPIPGQKTFSVKLRNRGGGIGPAQVLVNGTEVIADARPAGFDSRSKKVTLTIDLSNVKQIVPGRENKVEVVARNAAGWLNSRGSARGTELVVVDDGKALSAAPELYAIIGGVADYVDPSLNLAYSAKDSADFARALEIGATKFLGRDKVHIRLLTTEGPGSGLAGGQVGDTGSTPLSGSDSTRLNATKENFRRVFAEFAAKATTNDILVVYLSGHALALKLNQNPSNPGGDTYLYLTREAYTTDPAKLADEHVRTAMTLSGDELLESIKHIAALKKALVLDTCAAGAAAESLIARRGDATDTIKIRALENLKGTTGFFILMGSAGDKVSYEATPYRQGLLTYSLLEALKGAKLRDGGFADVGQVFGYAQNRVPEIARTLGLSQQPRFLAPDVGSPFDVGQYTIAEQKLFSLPSPNPLILRPSLQNKDLGYDNLKLLPVLNKALLEASYATGRGAEQASLVFVDASEMFDAFTPSGLYTVTGNQVIIKLNLIRNEQPAATLTVEGTVTDEESKAALVQKLVAAIRAETRKLLH